MINKTSIILSGVLSAWMAMASSCSVDEPAGSKEEGVFTIVRAETGDTRTVLGDKVDGKYPVLWQPGDMIDINGNASDPLDNSFVPSKSAQFQFSGVLLNTPYHALSPASALVSYSGGTATVNIPSVQTHTSGSFDPAAGLMLTTSATGTGLRFSTPLCFMRLTINAGSHSSHNISKVVISANGGEQMSGNFSTDYSTLSDTPSGKSSITLNIPAGLAQGGDVIIAYPARNYTQGLSLEIVDASGHFMRKISHDAHNPEPGHIFNTSVSFEPTGMYMGGDVPSDEMTASVVHTWKDMESATPTVNSHASSYTRSCLTAIGETQVFPDTTLYSYIDGHIGVCYPRFISDGKGGWLMFYHYGNTSTWAGNYSFFLTSPDLTDWSFGAKLFNYKSNQQSPYYDSTDLPKKYTRAYAGTDLCHLPDGRILAVAATRALSKYQQRPLDNGIAIRYSSDGGVTWTGDQLVMVGTCWEPYPLVLSSGRIQIYYTDAQPYYPEGNTTWGGTAVTSSGSSYIWSDDNGATWHWQDGSGEHYHAFRQIRKTATDGTKLYTDQMPVVLKLNNDAGLVGAMECLVSTSSSYKISLAYTGADGDWGTPDANGCLPADRTNNFVQGAAPYITQFPSGETVLVYNRSDVFYYQVGDAAGRNFQGERKVWDTKGFWGTLRVTGPNTLVAGLGGNKTTKNLRIGRFWLNHDIEAPSQTTVYDGKSGEWSGLQALYVGSTGSDQVILRAANDNYTNLSLLVEAVASNATVHVDLGINGSLKRISLNASGLASSEVTGVQAAVLSGETSDLRSGYIWEVSVPLVSTPGTTVPVKLSLEGNGFTDTFQPAGSSMTYLPRIIIQ